MKTKSFFSNFTFYSLLIAAVILVSCGQEHSGEQAEDKNEEVAAYTYAPLGPVLEMDASAEEAIREWTAYWELQEEMENFRSKSSGDLSYINEELIRIQGELIHDSIPEKVKTPAVKSRSLVFRTFAEKLQDQLKHRVPIAEVDTTRVKMLETYNAFRFHIADALREKVYEDFLERDTTALDTLIPQ